MREGSIKRDIVLLAGSIAGAVFFHVVRFNTALYAGFMTLLHFGSDTWRNVSLEAETRRIAFFVGLHILFIL